MCVTLYKMTTCKIPVTKADCSFFGSLYLFFILWPHLYLSISVQGSLNKFLDFFRMDTFIDSTHMKL